LAADPILPDLSAALAADPILPDLSAALAAVRTPRDQLAASALDVATNPVCCASKTYGALASDNSRKFLSEADMKLAVMYQ
jgi:hypothetical protein